MARKTLMVGRLRRARRKQHRVLTLRITHSPVTHFLQIGSTSERPCKSPRSTLCQSPAFQHMGNTPGTH